MVIRKRQSHYETAVGGEVTQIQHYNRQLLGKHLQEFPDSWASHLVFVVEIARGFEWR